MQPSRHLDLFSSESTLSCTVGGDGHRVAVHIYMVEDCDYWTLEVDDQHGTSTIWGEMFLTDGDAWNAFVETFADEGVEPLLESGDDRTLPHLFTAGSRLVLRTAT